MRPSFSVTLEPGLDRGVPWGRDLYTFVTSAAGHMMRTLQRPRKNRPSKRQVNHRRFLHNMIQRKFADIEAANYRLASALHFKEDDKNLPSLSSQKPEEPDRSDASSTVHTGTDGVSGDTGSSLEIQTSAKKWPESGHLWKRHPKSQLAASAARKNNQSKAGRKKENRQQKQGDITPLDVTPAECHYGAELYHTDYYNEESPLTSVHEFSEDSQTTQPDSSFTQFDQNVDVSPGLSPLSLDSCDFSLQMFTDVSSCAQAQKNTADVSESVWADIVDLFNMGGKDLAGCVDVEAYFESVYTGDAGQVSPEDVGFSHQSEGLTEMRSDRSEMEDLGCEENEYGYNWNRDQDLTINQSEDTVGMSFNNPEPIQVRDIIQSQSCCHYYSSQLYQHPQVEAPCMLGSNLSSTPFEGVAQSFSAPLLPPKHPPVPTLPQDEDWLFTDILKDRRSPGLPGTSLL